MVYKFIYLIRNAVTRQRLVQIYQVRTRIVRKLNALSESAIKTKIRSPDLEIRAFEVYYLFCGIDPNIIVLLLLM